MSTLTEGLNLEQKLGELLVFGFYGHEVTPEIEKLIREQHLGNIIFFSRNVSSPEQVKKLTDRLQQIAREAGHRFPLSICIDQENGTVSRVKEGVTGLPGNMALGAVASEELTYAVSYASGEELKTLGLTMNLAPSLDVNNNPANPVISVRSFGEQPAEVGRLGVASVRGYRDARIIPCVKHFPGHGDTAVDSHLSLPVIAHDLARLEAIELPPFVEAIEADVEMVMIAHLFIPALMKEEQTPSTISREVISDLLRDKLGFHGVVITDCLEMQAFEDTVGIGPGAVKVLQAGGDLVLISHRIEKQLEGLEAIKEALADGRLTEERITESAERVLALKARYQTWEDLDQPVNMETLLSPEHQAVRDQVYARTTTLVRDDAGLIAAGIAPEKRVLLVYPDRKRGFTNAEDRLYPHEHFVEQWKKRHAQTEVLAYPENWRETDVQVVEQAVASADLIIVVSVNAYLHQWQSGLIRDYLIASGKPVIGVAVYSPYDLLAFPELSTYLVTYEYTEPAIEAVVAVISGEQKAQGKLPISLPGFYEVGHGL